MPQVLSISVEMDAGSFHKFAAFDLLRHKKAWYRPLLFTAILLVFAGICLSQVGQREGAALLTVVLAVVALGLPAVWFWSFFHNLKNQIRKLGLPSRHYDWQSIHLAYRTPDAIYLYVQQNQAYLLNTELDAAWTFLQAQLSQERLRDFR